MAMEKPPHPHPRQDSSSTTAVTAAGRHHDDLVKLCYEELGAEAGPRTGAEMPPSPRLRGGSSSSAAATAAERHRVDLTKLCCEQERLTVRGALHAMNPLARSVFSGESGKRNEDRSDNGGTLI